MLTEWLRSRARRKSVRPEHDESQELFDEEFQRRLEYLSIVSRRVFAGRMRAERRSKKTGSGIEFADHRDYVPGDDFRYLDWNAYQRLGRLLVRLYEEEEDLSVHILLDASRSMEGGKPSSFYYGKKLAAALAYVALANLDRVSMVTFADAVQGRLPPTRGKHRIFKVFDFLRTQKTGGLTSFATSMKGFVAQQPRRGVAIVISDFYDPEGIEEGINALRYAKFETYVVHLVPHGELTKGSRGDLQLVDVETHEEREVTVTPKILQQYELARRKYRDQIRDFCVRKQVKYFEVDTNTPFDSAVLDLMRRSSMVR